MHKLRFLTATAILLLPLSASAWGRAQAQQSSDAGAVQSVSPSTAPQDSLAAAARHTKDQKKIAPKPKKVFTNDNIPTSGGISVLSTPADKAGSSDATSATAPANDEKSWRDKFAALRHKLEQDQTALDVMQRELGQLDVQYYPDPVKAMQQGYTRSDINDKSAQIEAKKKDIEADQQAISTAEDDLRKAGGDPGWAR
jgi:hypothetical protein